ncbi:MAG: hypothetical protein QM784_08685 [Polyangiaceae bacterium]
MSLQRKEAEESTDLPYSDGQAVPRGYHVVEEVRRGLVIGGSLSLGIPWLLGATVAVGNDFEDKTGYLMIPALGPWLVLAAGGAKDKSCSDASSDVFCDTSRDRSGERALLFLDGMAQVAGAVDVGSWNWVSPQTPGSRHERRDVGSNPCRTRRLRSQRGWDFLEESMAPLREHPRTPAHSRSAREGRSGDQQRCSEDCRLKSDCGPGLPR